MFVYSYHKSLSEMIAAMHGINSDAYEYAIGHNKQANGKYGPPIGDPTHRNLSMQEFIVRFVDRPSLDLDGAHRHRELFKSLLAGVNTGDIEIPKFIYDQILHKVLLSAGSDIHHGTGLFNDFRRLISALDKIDAYTKKRREDIKYLLILSHILGINRYSANTVDFYTTSIHLEQCIHEYIAETDDAAAFGPGNLIHAVAGAPPGTNLTTATLDTGAVPYTLPAGIPAGSPVVWCNTPGYANIVFSGSYNFNIPNVGQRSVLRALVDGSCAISPNTPADPLLNIQGFGVPSSDNIRDEIALRALSIAERFPVGANARDRFTPITTVQALADDQEPSIPNVVPLGLPRLGKRLMRRKSSHTMVEMPSR
jgi:hypothetical protein